MKQYRKYKKIFLSSNLLHKHLKAKGCKAKMNVKTELDTKTDTENYLKNDFSLLKNI